MSLKQVTVYKNRTTLVSLSVGFDCSNDVFTSQIRHEPNPDSELLAEWVVTFATDGTDGELILTIDNASVSSVTKSIGYMDVKRVVGGEPMNLFDEYLEVVFKDPVTM